MGRTSHYSVMRHLHPELTHRETGQKTHLQHRSTHTHTHTHTLTQEGINTARGDFIDFHWIRESNKHTHSYVHTENICSQCCSLIYSEQSILKVIHGEKSIQNSVISCATVQTHSSPGQVFSDISVSGLHFARGMKSALFYWIYSGAIVHHANDSGVRVMVMLDHTQSRSLSLVIS